MKERRVLFLGYENQESPIVDEVRKKGWSVEHASDKITDLSRYELVVSFCYRHIIPERVLKTAKRPVLNLHISYLPYNRGAHPNFWSAYENTPSGVTIHEIDTGIDTGPIVFQKYVNFSEEEVTFSSTYARLIREIEILFTENIDRILAGEYRASLQRGIGTYHAVKDLPDMINDWDVNVRETIKALEMKTEIRHQRDMRLVDEIQAVRSKNNVNWMDLLRIALTCSPRETKALLRRINTDDNSISELFRKLGE